MPLYLPQYVSSQFGRGRSSPSGRVCAARDDGIFPESVDKGRIFV